MDQGLIPRRYAKALYEVGATQGCSATLYAMMQRLSSAFDAEPSLQPTLSNPFVGDAEKERLIETATGEDGTKGLFKDFLALLRKNGRIDLMRDIANAYVDLYRKENRIYKVMVESAAPLTAAVERRMTDLITKQIGEGTPEITYEVNPALIGGFRVRVGNDLLDSSVSSRLNRIRQDLIK